MSEQIAFLRKRGGGLAKVTEKVLWSNPSPSANFAAQTVTLSDDINNYDYICIDYIVNKENPNISSRIIYPVDDFKTYLLNNGTLHIFGALNIEDANNNSYSRIVYYQNDTTIGFTSIFGVNKAYSTTNGANPLQILGLNIATDDKYTEYEIVPLGQGTSTATTALSITLNDSLSNYAYIGVSLSDIVSDKYIPSTNATYPLQIVSEVDYFKHNNVTGYYVSGATGSAYHQTVTYAYVDDTHITAQKTASTERTYYVYGIKATRKEVKKPEKYDVLPFKNVAAKGIPTFTTKGRPKAIWLTMMFPSSVTSSAGVRSLVITNVNPNTGEINNESTYRADSNSVGSIIANGQKFVITDNSVSTSSYISSYATEMSLAYTYE